MGKLTQSRLASALTALKDIKGIIDAGLHPANVAAHAHTLGAIKVVVDKELATNKGGN